MQKLPALAQRSRLIGPMHMRATLGDERYGPDQLGGHRGQQLELQRQQRRQLQLVVQLLRWRRLLRFGIVRRWGVTMSTEREKLERIERTIAEYCRWLSPEFPEV